MKYLSLIGEIDDNAFNKFIDELNAIDGEEFTLYLDSPGGLAGESFAMVDIINHYPSQVTIVATCELCSCAYLLFMASNSKKRLADGTHGVVHKIYFPTDTNDMSDPVFKEHIKSLDEQNFRMIKLFDKLGLSTEKIKEIESGKDVFIPYSELCLQTARAEQIFYKPKEVVQ